MGANSGEKSLHMVGQNVCAWGGGADKKFPVDEDSSLPGCYIALFDVYFTMFWRIIMPTNHSFWSFVVMLKALLSFKISGNLHSRT